MEKVEFAVKIFLPIYIVVYVLILYFFSISSFKKKYGLDPRVVKKEDQLSYFLQKFRDFLFLLGAFSIISYSFFPTVYDYLIPIYYLNHPVIQFAGIFLLITSPIMVRYAQNYLKDSWKIGVDRSETNAELITSGIFSLTRNPIAMGMMLTTLGLFLTIPNMITFTILNLTYLALTVRVMLEEEHLLKIHGELYINYQKKTRRWL